MIMSTTTPLMTVEELDQFPEDCQTRELWQGELVTMSPPGPDHSSITARIVGILFRYVDDHDLGRVFGNDCGYLLEENPDTLFGADVSFISRARLPQMRKHRGYFLGPPELAIEVVSPGDRIKKVHQKAENYIQFGAIEAWVVNPRDRSLTIYSSGDGTLKQDPLRLENQDQVSGRKILPGFVCSVSDLIGTMLFDK